MHDEKKKPSQAQIDANRRNSESSTGPTTADGKKRVSQNARKHGLTSRRRYLDPRFESEEDFASLIESLRETYQPGDDHEERLVEEIAYEYLQRDRMRRYEIGTIALYQKQEAGSLQAEMEKARLAIESRLEKLRHIHAALAELATGDTLSAPLVRKFAMLFGSEKEMKDLPDGQLVNFPVKAEKARFVRKLQIMQGDEQGKLAFAQNFLRETEEEEQRIIGGAALRLGAKDLDLLSRYSTTHRKDLAMLVRELERAQERRREWEKCRAEGTDVNSSDSQDSVASELDYAEQSQMMHVDALHGQAVEIPAQDEAEVDSCEAAIAKQSQFDVAPPSESSQQNASEAADFDQEPAKSAKQSQFDPAGVSADGEPALKKPSESVGLQDSEHTALGG